MKSKLTAIRAMEKSIQLHEDTNDNKVNVMVLLKKTIESEKRALIKLRLELFEAHGKISKAHAVIRTLHETLKTGQPVQWNHRETLEFIDDTVFEALLCIGTAGEMTE